MKKNIYRPYLFDTSQEKYKNTQINKIKTTDINTLLNRVRISKKIETKKKIIFSSLILLTISSVATFFLI